MPWWIWSHLNSYLNEFLPKKFCSLLQSLPWTLLFCLNKRFQFSSLPYLFIVKMNVDPDNIFLRLWKREEKDWQLLPLLEAWQIPVLLTSFLCRLRQGNCFGKFLPSLKQARKVKAWKDSSPSLLPVYAEAGEADGCHKKCKGCVEQQHVSGIHTASKRQSPLQRHLLHRDPPPLGLTGLQTWCFWSRMVAACSIQKKQQRKVLQHSEKNLSLVRLAMQVK